MVRPEAIGADYLNNGADEMAKKIKQDAAQYPVPQSREEANEFITRIGTHQRERTKIEQIMNDVLARFREKYEKKAAPHTAEIEKLKQGVHTWCEAHRHELTDDGKVKFARLASGEVKWRLSPYSCNLRKEDEVIARLKALGFTDWIRIKEAVDKEAILKSAETREKAAAVEGISIKQKEEFSILPFSTKLEEVAA